MLDFYAKQCKITESKHKQQKRRNKMRRPANIDKEQEAVFTEVKNHFGMQTIFSEGWKEMFAKFTKAYKPGLNAEQVIKAMESL